MSGEVVSEDFTEEDLNALIERTQRAEEDKKELTLEIERLSSAKPNKDENFLHHQIDTKEMLNDLLHFYQGDYEAIEDGERVWKTQTNPELKTFNAFGVSSMMELITKYIDKNTILSSYTESRIYEILGDLGDELILFLQCNYVQMGMDTYFKKTKFRLIITTTLHTIESTYRRAKGGKTMEEINQSKVVGQFGNYRPEPQRQVKKSLIPGL